MYLQQYQILQHSKLSRNETINVVVGQITETKAKGVHITLKGYRFERIEMLRCLHLRDAPQVCKLSRNVSHQIILAQVTT